MKINLHTAFFLLATIVHANTSFSNDLGEIVVQLSKIRNTSGTIHVGIEKSSEAFDKGPINQAQYRGKQVKVTGESLSVTFEDIPYGTYAIKVFHDENNNNEHDKNFLGIPNESYGFSNDARGTFGPAKFNDAKFEFKQTGQIIAITME